MVRNMRKVEPVNAEISPEVAEGRKRRLSRVLRLARAQLVQASAAIVAKKPKSARWYCMQVEPNREFGLEGLLREAGVDVLVPTETTSVVRRGRKFESVRPLLAGYMLVHIVPSPEAFQGLLRQKGVAAFVGGLSGYHIVLDEDVDRFRRLSPSDIGRMPTDKSFRDGDRAEVCVGPFSGFSCLVVQIKWSRQAKARIVIKLPGKAFEIESIPLAFLKRL